jgi:hypothetical protein
MFNVLYLSYSVNWNVLSESTNQKWFVVDRTVIVHIARRHNLAGNLPTHHTYIYMSYLFYSLMFLLYNTNFTLFPATPVLNTSFVATA